MFRSNHRLFATSRETRNGDTDIDLRAENPQKSARLCERCPAWSQGEGGETYSNDQQEARFECTGINPVTGKGTFYSRQHKRIDDICYQPTPLDITFDDVVAADVSCGIAPKDVAIRSGGKEVEA